MRAFEGALADSVLFTGFHGDKVWQYDNNKAAKTIVSGDASGSSLGEFRLRVGFIHLPIPFIGCLQHPSINEIGMSENMDDWYLRRDTRAGRIYNRPIPRRIAEEGGVPRDWFGQNKRAVTQPLAFVPREAWLSNQPLDNLLSEGSLSDFRQYLESISPAPAKRYPTFSLLHLIYRVNQSIAWRLSGKFKTWFPRSEKLIMLHWRYQYPLTEHLWGFHWGIERIRNRYTRIESKV
jgi:hypothetical protein